METDEHRLEPVWAVRYERGCCGSQTRAPRTAVRLCPASLDPRVFKNTDGGASGRWEGCIGRVTVSGEIKKGRLLAVPRAVPHKSVFLVTTGRRGGRRRTGAGAAVALPHLFPLGELFRSEDFLELGGDA